VTWPRVLGAQLLVALAVCWGYPVVGLIEAWVVPPTAEVTRLRQDSVLSAARLTVATAVIDTLKSWQATEAARLNEACWRLPAGIGRDPTLCREWLDLQRGRRGAR